MSHDTDARPSIRIPAGNTADATTLTQLDAAAYIRTPTEPAPPATGVWPSFMRRYTRPGVNAPFSVR